MMQFFTSVKLGLSFFTHHSEIEVALKIIPFTCHPQTFLSKKRGKNSSIVTRICKYLNKAGSG